MKTYFCKDAPELGREAAKLAAKILREAILEKGEARMVVSTGSSQFETFQALISEDIRWEKIEVFHLDEYIGLPITHKASFRKYLFERFIDHVPVKKFYSVETEGDLKRNIALLSNEISCKQIDLGLIGIGVNSHIAFNDPPADFNTRDPYIVVKLDKQCKMQQVNEGWFETFEDVPEEAISMSIWQIMQCKTIISCVPHSVKADAVTKTFRSPVDKTIPSTILKTHSDFNLFLDRNSSSGIITFSINGE
jgi:glucosamine-6-phosphate deaminase